MVESAAQWRERKRSRTRRVEQQATTGNTLPPRNSGSIAWGGGYAVLARTCRHGVGEGGPAPDPGSREVVLPLDGEEDLVPGGQMQAYSPYPAFTRVPTPQGFHARILAPAACRHSRPRQHPPSH